MQDCSEPYFRRIFIWIPPEFRSLVNNYRMNLLEVRKLSNTDMFHTDLKQVLDFIRYSKDKKKLRELVEQGLLTLRDAAMQAQMPESEFLAGMQNVKNCT